MHERLTELMKNAGLSGKSDSSPASAESSQNSNLNQALAEATQGIAELSNTTQSSVDSLAANTDALNESASKQGIGSSLAGTATQVASGLLGGGGILGGGILGGGLGLLFDGISSLFGGGSSQPAPLVQYQAPPSQNFALANSQGGVGDAVYDANGDPRLSDFTQLAFTGPQGVGQAGSGSNTNISGANSPAGSLSSNNVTVNVQAMDSRSFMDHSQDIAMAVRQAMLNMHSLNDVVSDL